MDWEVIRSRIMVFLVADAVGFVLFWVTHLAGFPGGYFEEILLLTLGISNGIILFAAVAACILLIPAAIARTYEIWFG